MRGKLFLYLALVCFIALIAIFFVDGYIGIYDTTYVTVGERQEVIEPDYWLQQYAAPSGFTIDYYISAEWGQKLFFRYEIDNRQFSSYSTVIGASLWQENEKLLDLFSGEKTIEPFGKATVEWTLSSEDLGQPVVGGSNQYTVKISYGEVERNIVVGFYYPGDVSQCHRQSISGIKMRTYILYGFGILLCISGISYLAAEYVKYLSEPGKLACLMLIVGMLGFLGKYFDEIGW